MLRYKVGDIKYVAGLSSRPYHSFAANCSNGRVNLHPYDRSSGSRFPEIDRWTGRLTERMACMANTIPNHA